MHTGKSSIQYQITLIEDAMKTAGIWSETIPDWVHQYCSDGIPDIWQWLQFVYLPMRKEAKMRTPHYLAPVITPHTGIKQPMHALILQRIVELDSMTSTLSHL